MVKHSKIHKYNIKEANKDYTKASWCIVKFQKQILESILDIFPRSQLSTEKYF